MAKEVKQNIMMAWNEVAPSHLEFPMKSRSSPRLETIVENNDEEFDDEEELFQYPKALRIRVKHCKGTLQP
ncbi:hypothetical protein LR48_Vigan05g179200 [Vigna angularis]|uniref:Uncharacterized protein n=2 Tax=Phaseolus angularis TaxID=3914 RepID=A0A0L9UNN3_PHAAN|nr:uncharacterized protein HKW66_Vig0215800 [Vigna angularis]KOM44187.1 hypothetical protein LR48_Vigan05g179200 [Vigna angularis]BAT91966.1 hypothetical protein VIGAN_07061600 [Vigna angularis var. angularis]